MAGFLQLKIVTPEGAYFQGPVAMVEIPTTSGQIGVLPGHVHLLTGLSAGEVLFFDGKNSGALAVAGGFAEIEPQCVRILADFAARGDDEASIEQACERARRALLESDTTPPEMVDRDLELLRHAFADMQRARRHRPL